MVKCLKRKGEKTKMFWNAYFGTLGVCCALITIGIVIGLIVYVVIKIKED